jgi:hypothetical protein
MLLKSTDYLTIELPAVVERFATDFDSLVELVDGVAAPDGPGT